MPTAAPVMLPANRILDPDRRVAGSTRVNLASVSPSSALSRIPARLLLRAETRFLAYTSASAARSSAVRLRMYLSICEDGTRLGPDGQRKRPSAQWKPNTTCFLEILGSCHASPWSRAPELSCGGVVAIAAVFEAPEQHVLLSGMLPSPRRGSIDATGA
jgi:hypothetical protein